jgi:hypothetical protein
MKRFVIYTFSLMLTITAGVTVGDAKTKTNMPNKTRQTSSRGHQSHYLIPSHGHSYDRHNTRSPKWHPTIHEHRHVHD